MAFYSGDICEDTKDNSNYRNVLFTVPKSFQLVLMSLSPSEEIGGEVHPHTTQFFHIVEGLGIAVVDGSFFVLKKGVVVVVPPGANHNIRNISESKELKLYTIYTPPEHKANTIQRYK